MSFRVILAKLGIEIKRVERPPDPLVTLQAQVNGLLEWGKTIEYNLEAVRKEAEATRRKVYRDFEKEGTKLVDGPPLEPEVPHQRAYQPGESP